MSKPNDPYAVTGVDPDSPAGKVRHDITETSQNDGFLVDHIDDVSVVTLMESNIVDAVQIDQLGAAIEKKLDNQDCPRIVIDLNNVSHLSSAALGMFLKLRMFATGRKGGICLCEVSDNLNQIFKVTRLDKMLPIHESRSKAVRSLSKKKR